MYRKNCDKCYRPSYSSSEAGEWICPICGHNLTKLPFFDAITLERVHINIIPIQRKLKAYEKQKLGIKT